MASDAVERIMENMVPELEEFQARGILSMEEVQSVVTRRRDFEYRLRARKPHAQDYFDAIAYEKSLDRLRLVRMRRLRVSSKGKRWVSDYSCQQRVHFLFDRLLRRFGSVEQYWLLWAEHCRETKAVKRLGRVLGNALRLLPHSVALWRTAASFEADLRNHAGAARAMMQRGLRMNKENGAMWISAIRLELVLALRLRARRAVLGLETNPTTDYDDLITESRKVLEEEEKGVAEDEGKEEEEGEEGDGDGDGDEEEEGEEEEEEEEDPDAWESEAVKEARRAVLGGSVACLLVDGALEALSASQSLEMCEDWIDECLQEVQKHEDPWLWKQSNVRAEAFPAVVDHILTKYARLAPASPRLWMALANRSIGTAHRSATAFAALTPTTPLKPFSIAISPASKATSSKGAVGRKRTRRRTRLQVVEEEEGEEEEGGEEEEEEESAGRELGEVVWKAEGEGMGVLKQGLVVASEEIDSKYGVASAAVLWVHARLNAPFPSTAGKKLKEERNRGLLELGCVAATTIESTLEFGKVGGGGEEGRKGVVGEGIGEKRMLEREQVVEKGAELLVRGKRVEDARKLLQKATEGVLKEREGVWKMRALLAASSDRRDSLQQAVRHVPHSVALWKQLALVVVAEEGPKSIIPLLTSAFPLCPDDDLRIFLLSQSLRYGLSLKRVVAKMHAAEKPRMTIVYFLLHLPTHLIPQDAVNIALKRVIADAQIVKESNPGHLQVALSWLRSTSQHTDAVLLHRAIARSQE